MAAVGHVHGDQQGRSGDQDELESPEADVGDGEEVVVADAVAARLLGIAGEAGLFVAPNALSCNHQDQDAKNEQDREPDAADASGVSVHTWDSIVAATNKCVDNEEKLDFVHSTFHFSSFSISPH
uniref:Uncharacterized protein n=1 Tax=Acanthochromis polyacanthus TaxID=80966 RepID=A0A3Q1I3I2_9TELE